MATPHKKRDNFATHNFEQLSADPQPVLHGHASAPLPPHASFDHQRRNKGGQSTRLVVCVVIAAVLSFTVGVFNADRIRSAITGVDDLDLSSVQETYRQLTANFDGDLSTQALVEGANRGLVEAAGDEYTIFMNGKESSAFDDSLTGNIGGGIGVEVGIRNDVPTVVRVLTNNAAEKAGVQVNDIITKVNDESTEKKSLTEVTDTIRGEIGTTVKLTVFRGGEEKIISVTRAQVNNPSAYGEVKDGIGVLTITRFDDNTGSLTRAVASDFKEQGVKGVILDLRGNGGGYVTAAQSAAGVWLDKKVVATERRNGKVTEELTSIGRPILNGIPTTILVNQSSASASEIVAGALRDHGAATLMGETTFGKGSVQKLVDLSNDAMLKVTIARWYTPKGLNISEKGIAPNVEVKRTADDINANRDPQLDTALSSF